MGPSYVQQLLWSLTPVHKMVPIYTVSYVLLWVHLMYDNYCGVLPLYIRWSLYIYSVIRTIMGPSYVHQLLWSLTPVHRMVPIYSVIRTMTLYIFVKKM